MNDYREMLNVPDHLMDRPFWCARAIYRKASDVIDVVPDRQFNEGSTDELFNVLNGVALHAALRFFSGTFIAPSSYEVLVWDDIRSKVEIRASPNGSHGYMYLCAVLVR